MKEVGDWMRLDVLFEVSSNVTLDGTEITALIIFHPNDVTVPLILVSSHFIKYFHNWTLSLDLIAKFESMPAAKDFCYSNHPNHLFPFKVSLKSFDQKRLRI
jgi:hypothetical protein